MFVAGMDGSELALARSAGLEPLGVVFGVANGVASLGGGISVIGERRGWEQLHLGVMRTARQRLIQQAQRLGAAGIVGVAIRVSAEEVDGSELTQLIVCQMSGTAVRRRLAAAGAAIWTATLPAQETCALQQAGFAPQAIVVGFGSIYANSDRWTARRQIHGETTRTLGQNIELGWMSETLQQARRLALAGVEAEAKQAGVAGIVDLKLDLQVQDASSMHLIVDALALGTAIAPLTGRSVLAPAGLAMDMAEAAARPR